MENKSKFYEVVLKCPLNDPLSDCAFNHYRQMPITKLIEVTQKISTAELNNLLALHEECISKRKTNKLAS